MSNLQIKSAPKWAKCLQEGSWHATYKTENNTARHTFCMWMLNFNLLFRPFCLFGLQYFLCFNFFSYVLIFRLMFACSKNQCRIKTKTEKVQKLHGSLMQQDRQLTRRIVRLRKPKYCRDNSDRVIFYRNSGFSVPSTSTT